MTSAINYLGINENFPVAGQDNDTQVFRDNFDTIKRSLQTAQTEITDLQDRTGGIYATETPDMDGADFSAKVIANAVFQNTADRRVDGGAISEALGAPLSIDFENGAYQIYRFGVDVDVDFVNFPTNTNTLLVPKVGKITLELYGDGTARTLTFVTSGGTVIRKNADFPAPFTVESDTDPVFVEVWQHSTDTIFMRYLGQFTE